MADFTHTFDIDPKNPNSSSASTQYEMFIARLRNFVRDPDIELHSSLPTLLPQQKDDKTPPCFDLVLMTEHYSITLRIRRDNIYMLGYKVTNGSKWYEFANKECYHFIPESTFLEFGDSYMALQNAAKRDRSEIKLGRAQLRTAVNELAKSKANSVDQASNLLIIVQIICESLRFKYISRYIQQCYTTWGEGMVPDDKMLELENCWARRSRELRDQPVYAREDQYLRSAEDGQSLEHFGMLIRGQIPRA
jgi:hypothetical protein